MKKRIAIATANDYLWQKIRLTLGDVATLERVGVTAVRAGATSARGSGVSAERVNIATERVGVTAVRAGVTEQVSTISDYDICLWDTDTMGEAPSQAIAIGRRCESPLPLSYEHLISLTQAESEAPLLERGDRCAILRGERIPLTEVEYALFDILYSARGEFVSREELMERVWGEAGDGVLNVYIHYLREKLERGEKIIISSRKAGYKIEAKFITGSSA